LQDIQESVVMLELESRVEIRPHCSNAELAELFRTSNFFVCFSEHEGFCVPLIEAQAVGLPVLGAEVAAVAETVGPGQFFDALPQGDDDYATYAAVISRLADDDDLREEITQRGERNVRERFADEPIENSFSAALFAALDLR
ncbi:MAG: glycosyltransferase, partial [Verrucomicrobiota bacterium]|nr:glycosyltransferase [Verrucomicrobiota bacterium]